MSSRLSLALDNQSTGRRRSGWLFWFSFVLAGIFLYFAFRGLDWPIFWDTLKNGRYIYLLLTVPIAIINYLIRALRWQILVDDRKSLSSTDVFWANMVGYMGNLYLPARVGELLRSTLLGRQSGKGTMFVLATALTERIIDTVALAVIGSGALLWVGELPPFMLNAIKVVSVGGTICLLTIFILPHQENLLRIISAQLPLSKNLQEKLNEQITRFIMGLGSLQNLRRVTKFLLYTLVIWCIDGWSIVIGALIISQTLSLPQALILIAALGLSSAIPSTPGYVGVYQFVAVSILVPFGFSQTDAIAYIVIIQISGFLIVTLLGLLGLWRSNQNKVLQPLITKENKD